MVDQKLWELGTDFVEKFISSYFLQLSSHAVVASNWAKALRTKTVGWYFCLQLLSGSQTCVHFDWASSTYLVLLLLIVQTYLKYYFFIRSALISYRLALDYTIMVKMHICRLLRFYVKLWSSDAGVVNSKYWQQCVVKSPAFPHHWELL